MPTIARKKQDERTRAIFEALKGAFPEIAGRQPADVVYLINPVSIRVRVIDDRFAGKETAARERLVNQSLKNVPSDAVADITMLLMLTRQEAADPLNLPNAEFDDPSRPML